MTRRRIRPRASLSGGLLSRFKRRRGDNDDNDDDGGGGGDDKVPRTPPYAISSLVRPGNPPSLSHTHGPNSDRQPRFHKFLHLLCPYLLALPCYLYPPCSGPIQSLALPTRVLVLDP